MDYSVKEAAANIIMSVSIGTPIEHYQISDLVLRLGGRPENLDTLTPQGQLLYLVSLIIVNT